MMYLLVFRFFGPVVDQFNQNMYRYFSRYLLKKYGLKVSGLPLWISTNVFFDRGDGDRIEIGDRCVISHGVKILTHDYSLDRYFERAHGTSDYEVFREAKVVISEQCFIGMNSLILPGVTIGAGAIVGAGSVVTRSVDADTVVAGVPAKLIGTTSEVWGKSHASFVKQRRRS